MKLNIYRKNEERKKEIVKTYTADTYDLMFGTLEDVAEAIKFDDLKSGSDEELIKAAFNLIHNSMGTVKDLLKDIFDGITDEDIRDASVKEIAVVLMDVVKYTIAQLGKGLNGKN